MDEYDLRFNKLFDAAANARDQLLFLDEQERKAAEIKPRSKAAEDHRSVARACRWEAQKLTDAMREVLPKRWSEIANVDAAAFMFVAAYGQSGNVGDLVEWMEFFPGQEGAARDAFWAAYAKRYPRKREEEPSEAP